MVDGGDQDPERPAARVVVLDQAGVIQGQFSGYGSSSGQLSEPHDLVVESPGPRLCGRARDGAGPALRPRPEPSACGPCEGPTRANRGSLIGQLTDVLGRVDENPLGRTGLKRNHLSHI